MTIDDINLGFELERIRISKETDSITVIIVGALTAASVLLFAAKSGVL